MSSRESVEKRALLTLLISVCMSKLDMVDIYHAPTCRGLGGYTREVSGENNFIPSIEET